MSDTLSRIPNACWPIVWKNNIGTSYLIKPNMLVTCAHVINGAKVGETFPVSKDVVVDQDAIRTLAGVVKVERIEVEADVAILRLDPPTDIQPLRLSTTSEVPRGARFDGAGYPAKAQKGASVAQSQYQCSGMAGQVVFKAVQLVPSLGNETPLLLPTKRASLSLYSDTAAAGEGDELHGFSGTPVVVGGLVVGHVSHVLENRDKAGQVVYGALWAVPVEKVIAHLQSNIAVHPPSGWPNLEESTVAPALGNISREIEVTDFAETLIAKGYPEFALQLIEGYQKVRAYQVRTKALVQCGLFDRAISELDSLALEDREKFDAVIAEMPVSRFVVGSVTAVALLLALVAYLSWMQIDWRLWAGLFLTAAAVASALAVVAHPFWSRKAITRLKIPASQLRLGAYDVVAALVLIAGLLYLSVPMLVFVVPLQPGLPKTFVVKYADRPKSSRLDWPLGAALVAFGCRDDVAVPDKIKEKYAELRKPFHETELPEEAQCLPGKLRAGDQVFYDGSHIEEPRDPRLPQQLGYWRGRGVWVNEIDY